MIKKSLKNKHLNTNKIIAKATVTLLPKKKLKFFTLKKNKLIMYSFSNKKFWKKFRKEIKKKKVLYRGLLTKKIIVKKQFNKIPYFVNKLFASQSMLKYNSFKLRSLNKRNLKKNLLFLRTYAFAHKKYRYLKHKTYWRRNRWKNKFYRKNSVETRNAFFNLFFWEHTEEQKFMLQKHALFRENCLNKIRIAYIKKATRLIPYVIKKFYLNYDSKKIVSWKARNRFIKGPKLTGNIWKYMWSVLFKLATLKGTDSLFAGNSKKNYFLMTHYYHLKSFTIVNSLLLFYQKQHELRNIFFSDKKFLRTQDIHWIYFKLFYKKKNIFSTFFHKKNWRPFMFSNKVIRDYNAPLLVWPIWHHKTYSKYLLSNLKKYVSKHWLVDFLGLGNNLLTKKNKDLFFNKHLFIKKNSKISTKFSYNSLLLNVYYNNINRFVFNNIKRGILKTSQLKSLSTKDKGYKKIAAIFFNNKLKVKPRYTSIFRYLKIYSKNKELIINKNSTIFKHNTVLQKTIKVSSTKQKNIVKNVDFNFVRGVYTTNLYYNKWNY